MNKAMGCVLLAVTVLCLHAGCRTTVREVSAQEPFMKGLKCDVVYVLKQDAFLRNYKGVISIERPSSPIAPYTIISFREGSVRDPYIQGVVEKGTGIVLEKVVLRDYVTHNALLYYADVRDEEKRQRRVLVNSLMDDPSEWLTDHGSEVLSEHKGIGSTFHNE